MKCGNPACSEKVPSHVRFCVVCGADAGFPNVRAASNAEETSALKDRARQVENDAVSRGSEFVLRRFRSALAGSSAVVCRALSKVNEVLSSDNEMFATFYQSVGGEARLPEENEWDGIRQSVDSLLFPYYFDQVRFAALSIDRRGVSGYGDYCLALKDAAIHHRATVFEENVILFVKRHRIVAGDKLPLGYRAVWENRDLLAVAKLGSKLTSSSNQDDFAHLVRSSPSTDSDFIEVHIYGPIHPRAIEHITGSTPKNRADKALLRSVLKKAKGLGITSEIF